MYNCENCGKEVTEKFSSGRFCSLKCSCSFSTKAKRKEINAKVSIALKGKQISCKEIKLFTCEICNKKFEAIYFKQTCSFVCRAQLQTGKNKKSGEFRKRGSGGVREGGGRSKVFEYISKFGEKMKLNTSEIQLAKILDCLKITWKRNFRGFEYRKGNQIRKFYPDFYIEDFDLYVEYKGWITEEMRHKMNDAQLRTNFKLEIVVGNDSRYKSDGISIEEFEKRYFVL